MYSHTPIEILEDRIAPAGLVNVTLVGGKLTIVGDAGNNALSVMQGSSHAMVITGANNTLLSLNGGSPLASVTVKDVTGNVVVNLGEGADDLSLIGLQLAHDLSVIDSGGVNTISLADLRVGGNLSITTGAGGDSISASGVLLEVGGNLAIRMGNGANSVGLSPLSLHAGGTISITGGDDADSISVGPHVLEAANLIVQPGKGSNGIGLSAQGAKIAGQLAVLGVADATHAESVSVAMSGQIGGALRVVNGGGTMNSTGLSGSGLTVGSLTVTGGLGSNSLSISDLNVRGSLSVLNPAGSSLADATGISPGRVDGSVLITGGLGGDSLSLALPRPVAGNVTVALGGGSDTASVYPTAVGGSVVFNALSSTGVSCAIGGANYRIAGGVTFLGGKGVNSLSVNGTNAEIGGGVLLRGGPDNDTFSFGVSEELYLHQAVTVLPGNGQNILSFSADSVHLGGHLLVQGGADPDSVSIAGKRIFLLGGASIAGGGGVNTQQLTGQDITVAGPLLFTGLDETGGTDQNIISATNSLRASSVTFVNGSGGVFDEVFGNVVALTGQVTAFAKNGSNTLDVLGTDLRMPAGATSHFGDGGGSVIVSASTLSTGHLSASFGKGSKSFYVFGTGKVGAVAARALDGVLTFSVLGGSSLQAGSVSLHTTAKTADTASVTLSNLVVNGVSNLNTGNATSGVTIDNLAARGAFLLQTGAGADDIQIEQSSYSLESAFSSVVSISTGAGADKIKIGANTADKQAVFAGHVYLNGGLDSDSVALDAFGNIFKGGKTIIGFETET